MRPISFVALVMLFLSSLAFGGQLAVSTFDTGDEGWTAGDFLTPSSFSGVNYLPTGGNPGGQIQVPDIYAWNAMFAPSAFLGNQSAAYGGSLTFDQYDAEVADGPYPLVMISDGTTFLYSSLVTMGTTWQTYSVQFVASQWYTDYNDTTQATDAQLQTVLANLHYLAIDADYHTGSDDVHLDNVILASGSTPTPEPASLILMAVGFAGLIANMRRR